MAGTRKKGFGQQAITARILDILTAMASRGAHAAADERHHPLLQPQLKPARLTHLISATQFQRREYHSSQPILTR